MIEDDLRSWSKEVLEVRNPHLGGLPACPFAKQAWRENKVLVVETNDFSHDSRRLCSTFQDLDKDLVVVATYDIPDLQDLNDLVEELNATHPDLHCMQFHPDCDAVDAELDFLSDNDWVSGEEQAYAMLFIQDLRAVVDASDRLERLGYYTFYPPDEYEALVVNRKRRLDHGHETQSDEARRRSQDDARRRGEDEARRRGQGEVQDQG